MEKRRGGDFEVAVKHADVEDVIVARNDDGILRRRVRRKSPLRSRVRAAPGESDLRINIMSSSFPARSDTRSMSVSGSNSS
ncbi:MAG: hypothetical protein U0X92_11140 [Anaerolineales bacterium]